MLLVFITGFVYMVMLDEPVSSKKYNLPALTPMKDAGELNRKLLKDSWQRLLPLAS